MKNISILLILPFLLFGCSGDKEEVNTLFIEFDVTKSYPVKELDIREIADINYLLLETHDDYLFSSRPQFISPNYIMTWNKEERGFVFFDKKGEPVSKVFRKGMGPEEYAMVSGWVYNEERDELALHCFPNEIMIYNRHGEFKRKFTRPDEAFYMGFYDFDADYLICYDIMEEQPSPFVLISKADGRIEDEIKIPFDKKLDMRLTVETDENRKYTVGFGCYFAVPNGKDFLLTEYSSDTVYRYTSDHQLIPVLVRKPSIQTMDPQIALHSWVETNDYYFLSTTKRVYDWKTDTGFPETGYMIEKSSGDIYQQKISNKEFAGKELIIDPSYIHHSSDSRTGFITFSTEELQEAHENGQLSGELKEIAEKMNDDDLYVIMIVNFK